MKDVNILIVESDKDVRKFFTSAFEIYLSKKVSNFNIFNVGSYVGALNHLKENNPFSLLTLNLIPAMNGEMTPKSFLEYLKNEGGIIRPKYIALFSGYPVEEVHSSYNVLEGVHYDEFFTKPIKFGIIGGLVEKIVKL